MPGLAVAALRARPSAPRMTPAQSASGAVQPLGARRIEHHRAERHERPPPEDLAYRHQEIRRLAVPRRPVPERAGPHPLREIDRRARADPPERRLQERIEDQRDADRHARPRQPLAASHRYEKPRGRRRDEGEATRGSRRARGRHDSRREREPHRDRRRRARLGRKARPPPRPEIERKHQRRRQEPLAHRMGLSVPPVHSVQRKCRRGNEPEPRVSQRRASERKHERAHGEDEKRGERLARGRREERLRQRLDDARRAVGWQQRRARAPRLATAARRGRSTRRPVGRRAGPSLRRPRPGGRARAPRARRRRGASARPAPPRGRSRSTRRRGRGGCEARGYPRLSAPSSRVAPAASIRHAATPAAK